VDLLSDTGLLSDTCHQKERESGLLQGQHVNALLGEQAPKATKYGLPDIA
jgi:hypothetical protein